MGEYDAKPGPANKLAVASSKAPQAKQDRAQSYLTDPKIAAKLWHAIGAHLGKVDLPPAARSIWTDENKFVAATLQYLRPFELFLARDRLVELVFPTKPYEAIANVVPFKDTWEPAIGVALAPLFEEAILGSLRRLGPRWVELAENQPREEALLDDGKSLVAESSLTPSHPMDLAVRRGLTTDGVIDLKAGVLPVAKRKKLRAQRQVKVQWEGARDRSLWNFVRPDHADATAEEVAAALFTNFFWRADGAIYAHRLTKIGGLFGVPEGMARKFDDARKFAPGPGEKPKSREVASAGSKTADELGKAEAGQRPTSILLRWRLANSVAMLQHIQKTLLPWKLEQTVAVGLAWATSKQAGPDEKLVPLSGVITEQEELLGKIVARLKWIPERELTKEERTAMREPLALCARAAASSHLPATGNKLLAAVGRKQIELVVSALRESATDLTAVTRDSDPTGRAKEVTARSRRLQTQLLQTGSADPKEVEATILTSQEAALEARLAGLREQAHQLHELAREAQSIWVVWHIRFEEIKGVAAQLQSHVDLVRGMWAADQRGEIRGDAEHLQAVSMERRRAALTKARDELEKLRHDKVVVDLLQNGVDVIKDHQSYVKWTKVLAGVAIMIGLSFIGGPVGARVGSWIAGRILAAELGVGLLASAGRFAAAGIEVAAGPATEIALNSVAQVAIQGGSLREALLENTIQTIASAVILRKIGGSLEVAKQVERQSAKLWSARNRAGAAILDAGVTVSAHVVINIATAYVARQITLRALPVHAAAGQSDALEEVFMQGASIALGRLVHGRLDANKELHDKLANHPRGGSLIEHRKRLQLLADTAEHSPRPDHALEIVAELEAVHSAEVALLEHIRDTPAGPDIGIDPAVAGAHVRRLARTSELEGVGLEALPLRQAHLEEVIPGEHWAGTREHIEHAIALAKKTFKVTETRDPATGRWRVTIDGHPLVLEERSFGPHAGPKTARSVDAPRASIVETRAEVVPGSSFRGIGGGTLEPGAVKATLERVLAGTKGVEEVMPLDVLPKSRPEDRYRQGHTLLVTLAGKPTRKLTIRVDTAPLEGLTVARSWVNSTQQGFSTAQNKDHRVLGRHVIQLSNELDIAHAERAIGHEVAEIFEIDRLNSLGKYGGPDALRPDATGTELSPHDLGRLAEIEVLSRSADQHAAGELQALVEHLGLREGTEGADRRLALATRHMSKEAAARLRDARHEPTTDAARAQLQSLRERASRDHATEQARATARERVDHDMPSLLDENKRPLTGEALAKAAADAMKDRADQSRKTLSDLKKAQANHSGDGIPELPYPGVMIGGGASLAARDRAHLLVDDRGRWQADGNIDLAQTGNQLKHTADAKLGDPRIHVEPNKRLPLDALRAWEDKIAAQGPVIDGRANLRFGSKGEPLIDLLVGNEKLTFKLPGIPTIATGFVPERVPGAPFNLRPSDVAQDLRNALDVTRNDAALSEDIRRAATRALAQLDKTPIVTNDDAGRFISNDILDPTLRTALASNDAVKKAIQYGEAVKNWHELIAKDDPNNPHVFYGDHANLGREHAMRSNNWVIAGTGGTGVSAAELILKNNPLAKVTMVGNESPAGLLENDQFRMLAEEHAAPALAASMGITKPTSGRLSIRDGYVAQPIGSERTSEHDQHLVDESKIPAAQRSKRVYDVNGRDTAKQEVHTSATAYVASLGRNNDYPPLVGQLISQIKQAKGDYYVEPLFHDRQYVGYRVRFVLHENDVGSIDVTGAASRFLPIADAKLHADVRELKNKNLTSDDAFRSVERATEWDAPAESGNFGGGFAATATQTSRYGQYRNNEAKKVKP